MNEAETRAELTQSLLQEAFSGELTPEPQPLKGRGMTGGRNPSVVIGLIRPAC